MAEQQPVISTESLAQSLLSDLDRLNTLRIEKELAGSVYINNPNENTEKNFNDTINHYEDLYNLINASTHPEVRDRALELLEIRRERAHERMRIEINKINEAKTVLDEISFEQED